MKKADIQVGKTYKNRLAGLTYRKVLAIGHEHRPALWYGLKERPDEPGVLYSQGGYIDILYLSSFAKWAGGEVNLEDSK